MAPRQTGMFEEHFSLRFSKVMYYFIGASTLPLGFEIMCTSSAAFSSMATMVMHCFSQPQTNWLVHFSL